MLTIMACILIVVLGLAALLGVVLCGAVGFVALAWKAALLIFAMWVVVKIVSIFKK